MFINDVLEAVKKNGHYVKNMYFLTPTNQKSFYEKARVFIFSDDSEILVSYDTAVIFKNPDGELMKLWSEESESRESVKLLTSATTCRHVMAYCGLNKKDYKNLPTVHK